jgi:hypothetical protein
MFGFPSERITLYIWKDRERNDRGLLSINTHIRLKEVKKNVKISGKQVVCQRYLHKWILPE